VDDAIPVGVSACLLGQEVRYDGGHKRDRYVTDTLADYFTFVPVCPETECGLGIPREPMRLVADDGAEEDVRLITVRTGVDLTERMRRWSRERAEALSGEGLCGFIFKKDSPSSGLFRVKLYHPSGQSSRREGRGLFADALTRRLPLLPVEEEGRLNDARLRENFIERVFAMKRWRDFLADAPDYRKLIQFHTRQKLLIMAHDPEKYGEMGRLVARGKEVPREALLAEYGRLYMKSLETFATVGKNTNVLQHIMGYFRDHLTADEKAELLEVLEDYRAHLVPLTVPMTLVKHYVRKFDIDYLADQVYLAPHPAELMLRNHV